MDGNGRWAKARNLRRLKGHEAGIDAVQNIVESAPKFGVKYLTLFAFSTENWQRSQDEIDGLFFLFRHYFNKEQERLLRENVRIKFIGDRAKLPTDLQTSMASIETRAKANTGLNLQVALNYGGQDEILRAVNTALRTNAEAPLNIAAFEALLDTKGLPPVDLVIRTSGEKRISNFLLWQAAYAEYDFVDKLWPDYSVEDFKCSIENFHNRDRRFGKEESV